MIFKLIYLFYDISIFSEVSSVDIAQLISRIVKVRSVVVISSDWFSDHSSSWRGTLISTWAQNFSSLGNRSLIGVRFSEAGVVSISVISIGSLSVTIVEVGVIPVLVSGVSSSRKEVCAKSEKSEEGKSN